MREGIRGCGQRVRQVEESPRGHGQETELYPTSWEEPGMMSGRRVFRPEMLVETVIPSARNHKDRFRASDAGSGWGGPGRGGVIRAAGSTEGRYLEVRRRAPI